MRSAVYSAMLLAVAPVYSDELAESLWRQEGGKAAACGGYYVELEPKAGDSNTSAIDLRAGSLTSRIGEQTTIADGIAIRQGERLLRAPNALVDELAGVATVETDARISEPGLHLRGDRLVMDLTGNNAELTDAEFVQSELQMRGQAKTVRKRGRQLNLADAWLTRCPPNDETWRLSAAAIDIDDETLAARHVRLAVRDVPIFYAPYLRLPLRERRASGFLLPSLAYGQDGVDLTVPYYLNLAPNYDATFGPRLISERGNGLEAQFRHMSLGTESQFDGAILFADERYDGQRTISDALAATGEFVPADRWLLGATHRGRWRNLRTRVDYAAVSDDDYFVDLGADVGVASRVLLERRGEIEYARGGLLARLWAQGFQRLTPGLAPYRRLPEANLIYRGNLVRPLAWSLAASWVSFDRNTPAAPGLAAVTGQRLHLAPRLRLPLSRSWGFLTLSAGWRHTRYDLAGATDGVAQRPKRDVHWASVDGGLFAERELSGGRLQTLEPRLYYFYQSHVDQSALPLFDAAPLTFSYRQLFRDNRFAGLDRVGDANQLAAGLTSRLLAATGKELFTASLGAIAYFEDRRVVLTDPPRPDQAQPSSALAGELATALGPLRLRSTLAWDANDNVVDEAALRIAYRSNRRRIVNVTFRRRPGNETEQTDFSIYWPLSGRWNAFGRWNHDWRYGQIIEGFAGVGYASCCLEVKLLAHRTVAAYGNRPTPAADWNSGVLLQVVFRGLAGFGTKVDSRLARGIKGYDGMEIP